MARTHTPVCETGTRAVDFALPDVDGTIRTRDSCRGENGLLVMFICNHCPYVKAILDRIVRDTRELEADGIGSVAIMPNDTAAYPEDSPERMREMARSMGFGFPYLIDRDQHTAHAYGAVCTPDFFGFNRDLQLQYRGRLDASGREPALPETRRELFEAMRQVARTGTGPDEQIAGIGCSIKWKQENSPAAL